MNFKKLYREANDQIKADPALIYLAKSQTGSKPVKRFAPVWLSVSAAAVVAAVLCLSLLFHQAVGPAVTLKEASSAALSKPDDSSEAPSSSAEASQASPESEPAPSFPAASTVRPNALPLNAISLSVLPKQAGIKPLSSSFQSVYEQFASQSSALLLKQQSGQNKLVSPASLFLATAMLAECTAGDTRQELLNLLKVGDLSELRSQIPQFFRNNYFDEKSGKLQIANSIWINKNASVKKSLTDTLAGRYYASSYYAAFGTTSAVEQLKEWLSDHTGGRLGDKIPAAEDQATHSILVSTLYYYDQWDSAFSDENNVTAPFYPENGSGVQAEYMTKEKTLSAFDGDGYQAVDLELHHTKLRLVLPDEGVSPMTLAGDPARLAGILSVRSGSGCQVDLRLPKFELTAKSDLVRDLPALGVKKVFTPGTADFSPLTDDLLYVGEAAQKTFFSVDEKGCEAAAYTYYANKAMGESAIESAKRILHFDRPFLFAVMRDDAPLFIGVVSNPAAK